MSDLAPLQTFDDLIQPVVNDEVTVTATTELKRLQDTYEPRVRQALQLQHTIPNDPVALGLSQFNERLASLNHDITTVSQLLALLIFEKRNAQDRKQKAKSAFEEKFHLLVNHNDKVREAEGGQKGRELAARALMQREQRIVDYCDQMYTTILQYHESVKLALDTLKATKRDNMDQLSVIKEQIRAGEIGHRDFPIEGGYGTGQAQTPQQRNGLELEAELREALPGGEGHTSF